MNITKRIAFVVIFTLIIGFSVISLFPKEPIITKGTNRLRIGTGDDASGLLLKQIKNISENVEIDTVTDGDLNLETLQFKDC